MIGYTIKFSHFEYGTLIWENYDHPISYLLKWGIMWVKQCHFYHPWLGMVNIPPIKMDDWVIVYFFFTLIPFPIQFFNTPRNHKKSRERFPHFWDHRMGVELAWTDRNIVLSPNYPGRWVRDFEQPQNEMPHLPRDLHVGTTWRSPDNAIRTEHATAHV